MVVIDPYPEGAVVRLKGGKMGTVKKRAKTRVLVALEGSGAEEWVDEVELEAGEDAPIDTNQREDMIQLAYLNEPSVLNNLKVRYAIDQIYTYTGSILIAVNPFKDVTEGLYGPFMMDLYRGRALGELSPHVYAIADAAYRDMQEHARSHSILVSGESGAGKTETCKLLMGYLAYMIGQEEAAGAGPEAGAPAKKTLQEKVLESNPLLEAFGNAKTVRNDNSSRFGKFTEIQFRRHEGKGAAGLSNGASPLKGSESGAHWSICGAAIRTYLLERSRVVSVADPERNYHIFYQLCMGASDAERAALHLGAPSDFYYLNRSSCLSLSGVDDAEEYLRTKRAMSIVGVSVADQDACMRVLAAILHLGNVALEATEDGEGSRVAADEPAQKALGACAELLGVDRGSLAKSLTVRSRDTRDGVIESPLLVGEARNSRDALAKKLYALLFDWLVGRVNASMGHDPTATSVIGILDIYGFEEFKTNDFEQFCINYANEKLQQHFNKHVFKMEQQEYQREEINWSYIEFVDNQDVLDLIERRPAQGKAALSAIKEGPQVGVLALLDEQCKFPRATHEDFALKLRSTPDVTQSSRFKTPKMSQTAFTLEHYAGSVTYQTENFLEKNRDFVIADHEALLRGSSFAFLRALLDPLDEGAAAGGAPRAAFKFSSVGGRFQVQLTELMETLSQMEPHYIRCIKPNDRNLSNLFDPVNVVHQLRCGGVLEAVRISCAGYPSRMPYEEFADRFRVLCPSAAPSGPGAHRLLAEQVLRQEGIPDFQLGVNKVFLRSGHLATLEKSRAKRLQEAAVRIQAHMRGYHQRLAFQRLRAATALIQRVARGFLARRKVAQMRRERAAVTIQRLWRGAHARHAFQKARAAAVLIQAVWRGRVARRQVEALRRERAALVLQSMWRMSVARRAFLEQRDAAVKIQSAWRALKARRLLKKLKREARESTKLLEDNRSLQERVRELREEKENVINQRNELKTQLQEAKAVWKKEREELQGRLERLEGALQESQAQNASLAQRLEGERAERRQEAEGLGARAAELQGQVEGLRAELEARARALEEQRRAAQQEQERLQLEVQARAEEARRATDAHDKLAEKHIMLQQENEHLRQRADGLRKQLETAALPSTPPPHPRAPSVRLPEGGAPQDVPTSPHLKDPHPAAAPAAPPASSATPATAGRSPESRMQQLSSQEQERERQLVELLKGGRLGFVHGRPVAALVVFRGAVEWRAFQNANTSFFDRVMDCIQGQLLRHADGNLEGPQAVDDLAYWLSVQANLLALIQRYTRASMQAQPGAARVLNGNFGPGSATKLNIKGWAGAALAMFSGHGRGHPALPAPEPEDAASIRFEAKYPCLLFKQQVDSNVTKIFSMLREAAKKSIAPLLASLMLQPKNQAGRQASARPPSQGPLSPPPGLSASDPLTAMLLGPRNAWQELVAYFQELLTALQRNHVPKAIVRRLFGQLALDINSQGFNQLVLRRECCSFSNGEYIKLGMAELENWLQTAGDPWVGEAFEELRHLRQAVNFLVIDKKPRKTYEEIKEDLCKDLTVQQIYRLSTMYWDDRYGTETVSKEVMDRMRMIMNAGGSSGTFILDSSSIVHASWEDLQAESSGALQQMDVADALGPQVLARLAGDLRDLGFLRDAFDALQIIARDQQLLQQPGTPSSAMGGPGQTPPGSGGFGTPPPPGLSRPSALGGIFHHGH